MLKKTDLPKPSADQPLTKVLTARIRASGAITVADYMETALGHKDHGYYITQDSIGAAGDFITAPEVSQMFGEMIGIWLVDFWLQSGRPDSIQLIELGPGRGTLAADVLRTISAWPACRQAVSVHLVETSPRLRQIQFDALKSWHPTWHDSLQDVPSGFSFILANEFFDALPVHQFEKTQEGWKERRIDWSETRQEFFFTTAALDFDAGAIMPNSFLNAPLGSVFELSPVSLSLVHDMAVRIAENGGAGLIIDYGHQSPGWGDTLQAVSRHQFSSILTDPGSKDLTAHVDFSTLAIVAQQHVRVHGPVTQGAFLESLGILARAEKLRQSASEKQKRDILTALHRLTAPSQMGGLFKVMGLTPKDSLVKISGFNEDERIKDNDDSCRDHTPP